MVDAALRPKILDFGLSGSDPASGHFVGTVRYIAPEQLDRQQPIDARTDVYALGVILYELLAGDAPFRGASDAEVIAAIQSGQPRLPIEIDARVPPPLQAIALKAMERRPSDRYASARDLVLDLDRYLEGRPVLARPTLVRHDAREPCAAPSRSDRRVAPAQAHPSARGHGSPGGLSPARRTRRRLDRRQPGAHTVADRVVPRCVLSVCRQPLLLRRASLCTTRPPAPCGRSSSSARRFSA